MSNLSRQRAGVVLTGIVMAVCLVASASAKAPNIVLLLADDLGYGELGSYGQEAIETPVLDGLAATGMRFTNFYAGAAVCAPSRSVLMTGKHGGHATVRGNSGYYGGGKWSRVPLRKDEETLAEMLKRSGYETAFIGKWHLDDPDDPTTWAFARGFDFAVQPNWPSRFEGYSYDEDIHYFGNKERSVTYDWRENDCIDSFRTDLILEYLDGRTREKPLFLFMSYRTPHTRENVIRDREMYADCGWKEVDRRHAARITMLDQQVGRLLAKLEEQGELDNTLILFVSDNGPHSEGGHDYRFFDSSGGLRGYKRDLYEGGIRVPAIAVWKDHIKEGSLSTHLAAFCDIMATFSEVSGGSPVIGDGISFMPEMLGQPQKSHEYLYWELQLDGWNRRLSDGGFRQAVRKGDWKAVRYGAGSAIELYDLGSDPFETTDVASAHPLVVTEMAAILNEARTPSPLYPFAGLPQSQASRDTFNLVR
ncbi:sulfatase-like hydrolase/transferase [Puniceicoccales bacterium CK1056]|uniref:Sulfatase-like hydrolase/transferase n=1 Tax=Oceanipulchritudo coccoides TaxID=2706888 RepID=A0A6B2M0C4_9BACT|nr:sulfatase-like hydrolase/transferase [Oceanipulchritudo coccoides]NDV61477.1 sulfatase-like hydrolase/transferase [Oceanipulchritudo coccoides]